MEIKILGPKNCPSYNHNFPNFVNVTSHSKDYGRNFSPFFLGPISTYPNAPNDYSKSVENLWQYCKVYSNHVGEDGNPTDDYFKWARCGFIAKSAHRYPMGKGASPEYAWWNGQKLSYIEARKKIYIPKYIEGLEQIPQAVDWLRDLCKKHSTVYLWDFDCNVSKTSLYDVVNDPYHSMGHAYVIKMYLEDKVKEMIGD